MPCVTLTRREAENGQLPAVCILCGEPAARQVNRVFTYNAEGAFPTDVVAVFTLAHSFQKICLALPVCAAHEQPPIWQTINSGWRIVGYFGLVMMSLCALDLYDRAKFNHYGEYLLLFFVVGAFAWWLWLRRQRAKSLEVVEMTKTTVTLSGVCQRFADAC